MSHSGVSTGRRGTLKVLGAAAAFPLATLIAPAAHAADFPASPVTLVVPWTPGGPTDNVLRALATASSKHLGQQIIILNKPGAGGTLGPATMAATARPDGYTVSQVALSLLRLPHMQNVSYDPLKDFTYIIGLSGYATGIMVKADAPWKTWKELVDYARANPGVVTYATTGMGTSLHITMEEISRAAGIQLVNVPYKGTAESTMALMSGQVMLQPDGIGSSPMLAGGQVRVLVNWGEQRNPQFPDVPTLKESGLDIVSIAPFGLAGPKGMDPNVVKILHDAFKKGLDDPAYKIVAGKNGLEPFYRSSQDFTAWAAASSIKEGRMVRELGLAKPL
ncbi:MAG: tripartite tricarboxylate transporter substrate binding protein [Comamonadaceae bacterium]|nr:MAG: tripartite tricarboxylate transporter substrate binding protein [Comamonadaceae bacterium]